MSTLEYRAQIFATNAHGMINQRRLYTREHYIVHPAHVAEIVRSVPHTEEMLAAAWLHDTVEDTPVTIYEVRHFFGNEVADRVAMLTNVSKPIDGNRAKRKAIDMAHLAKASPAAMTVKLADLIDNTHTIVKYDPSFAAIYLPEKRALLEVLRAGDATLWERASQMVEEGFARLQLPRTA
jgi:(p)ppGpp synthase/HD superfamily hydrolase